MYDYNTVKMLHSHGNGDYVPMVEGNDHTSASHDPERAWLAGAKIFAARAATRRSWSTRRTRMRPGKSPARGPRSR